MSEVNERPSALAPSIARFTRAAALALCCSAAAANALAQGAGTQAKPAATPGPAGAKADDAAKSEAQKWFTDVELLDQDGRRLRLYSDLLKGKTVVVNAFFATCKGVCPPMSENLRRVQEAFKGRVGKDLHIISITVDPETDTPALLKDYAK